MVHTKVLAAMFLNGASSKRFKPLMEDIANQFTFGKDNYPATLEDAVRLLNNYRGLGWSVNMETKKPGKWPPWNGERRTTAFGMWWRRGRRPGIVTFIKK